MNTEFNAWPRPSLWDILPKSPFQEIKTRWINIKRMISGEAVPRRTRTLENSLLVVCLFLNFIYEEKRRMFLFRNPNCATISVHLYTYYIVHICKNVVLFCITETFFWQTKHLQNLKIKLRNKTPCASSIV